MNSGVSVTFLHEKIRQLQSELELHKLRSAEELKKQAKHYEKITRKSQRRMYNKQDTVHLTNDMDLIGNTESIPKKKNNTSKNANPLNKSKNESQISLMGPINTSQSAKSSKSGLMEEVKSTSAGENKLKARRPKNLVIDNFKKHEEIEISPQFNSENENQDKETQLIGRSKQYNKVTKRGYEEYDVKNHRDLNAQF
ncbi:unnamed protein product [Moneuplotes crassus]|uniref:Uncharacterized protein n=1 Tax=Euplotes crassus TaxID=5936 RepID=A0AAD2D9C5_EUPCR|nr:unnamed protein product [Moneuplotes crassus]